MNHGKVLSSSIFLRDLNVYVFVTSQPCRYHLVCLTTGLSSLVWEYTKSSLVWF